LLDSLLQETFDTWLVNMISWRLAAEATTVPHA